MRLGSTGDDVRRLETRLQKLGLYNGAIDGSFGGGVEAAVKKFQSNNGLEVDGKVGPNTWKKLFPAVPPPVNALLTAPLAQRCLALTGTFETSTPPPECFAGLTGNFDGQGISFGVLQWNLGQGSLQPLLNRMLADHPAVIANIFHDRLAELKGVLALTIPKQLTWSKSIQDPAFRLFEPWRGMFKALGRTPEFQAIQVAGAEQKRATAAALCKKFQVTTERAMALMFDITTQNGSISAATEALIRADYAKITATKKTDIELERLRIIANRRAEAANPKFVEDVRARKLCIANGEGTVHGSRFNLEEQFGIRLV